jgi:hypothetical protein
MRRNTKRSARMARKMKRSEHEICRRLIVNTGLAIPSEHLSCSPDQSTSFCIIHANRDDVTPYTIHHEARSTRIENKLAATNGKEELCVLVEWASWMGSLKQSYSAHHVGSYMFEASAGKIAADNAYSAMKDEAK